ncbi:hypothetical protein [Tardiphaga sp.]|jgi:hypothetical protein|uniref:hypothetical protein n=1 Tax=Tardiphaga sp. TaxID=1926292 RepID=UPI0037DA4BD9
MTKPTAAAWAEQAAELRRRADNLPAGEDRERLLNQADQLDAAVDMTKILSVQRPSRGR